MSVRKLLILLLLTFIFPINIFAKENSYYLILKNNEVNVKQIKNIKKKILKYQRFIKDNCKDVGTNFAQEARSIHYEKKDSQGIYGKTTPEEASELIEEGIDVITVPWVDKSEN